MTDNKKTWTSPIVEDLDIDPAAVSALAGTGSDAGEFGGTATS